MVSVTPAAISATYRHIKQNFKQKPLSGPNLKLYIKSPFSEYHFWSKITSGSFSRVPLCQDHIRELWGQDLASSGFYNFKVNSISYSKSY